MKYLTVKETALRWGVSIRTVNSLCAQGRVNGAEKFGSAWAIPEYAEKPGDPRRERKKSVVSTELEPLEPTDGVESEAELRRVAMPLLNTPFRLGHCMEAIEQMEDPDLRNIAMAEYWFFSGRSEKVSELLEPYLTHDDIALRVSACFIYTYANIVTDNSGKAKYSMELIKEMVDGLTDETPERMRAYATSAFTAVTVLLHMPMPKILTSLKTYIHMMPPGLRLFVLYIEAHHAYLNRQYGVAIGIAETALALESELYPIPTVYLHLIACVGYLNMKHPEMAKEHVLEAWKIAQPDDFIHPIAELHGLMGGTLEATLKRMFPHDFKRIIAQTYRFSSGWRRMHNRITGNNISDDLTTTEFAAAMLAARGWTSQEIADHMGISEYTARRYVSMALQKLNVSHKKDLPKYLLQ